jgi:hypothetical protein
VLKELNSCKCKLSQCLEEQNKIVQEIQDLRKAA